MDKTAAGIKDLQEDFAELAAGLDIFGMEKVDSSKIVEMERVSVLQALSPVLEKFSKHISMGGGCPQHNADTAHLCY